MFEKINRFIFCGMPALFQILINPHHQGLKAALFRIAISRTFPGFFIISLLTYFTRGGLFVARFTGQAGLAAAIIYFHIDSNTLN